jgi:DNA-binding NarL/FixJ family response regulator
MSVRILLVDAHDDARVSLARRLGRDPALELLGAASCVEEAAGILLHDRPDIVLLDIQQGDERGVNACRKIRELTEAPVVAFTSFITPELWETVSQAGATDSLLKNIDTDRLGREIRRLAELHGSGAEQKTG